MSRRLLAFLLSELDTIRLICQNPACNGIAEFATTKLALGNHQCRFCGFSFMPPTGTMTPLDVLGKAILAVQGIKDRVEVELIIPDKAP